MPENSSLSDSNATAFGASPKPAIPLGSSFNDLFSGGASVWMKILGAAVAVPVAVFVYGRKATRNSSSGPFSDSATLAMILIGSSAVGAFLGAALSMKDVVDRRRANGQPVAFPLRLLFGFGIFSIFAWIPIGLTITIIALAVLG